MPLELLQIFSSVGNVLMVVVGFGFIIFVHELGHFIFAKKVGAKVEIFSIGFGPKLFGATWGGTEYRVSLIPLGGYVKITGQGSGAGESKSPDDFERKPVWQRFQVLVAGVLMNFIFAFPLCMAVYLLGRSVPDSTVADVAPGSPAFEAGLKPDDCIRSAFESSEDSVDKITTEQWDVGRVRNWERVNQLMLLGDPEKSIFIEVGREGREQPLRLRIAPRGHMKIQQRVAAIGMQGGGYDVAVGALSKGSVNEDILREGDVIESIDGVPVSDPGILNALIFHAYLTPSEEAPGAPAAVPQKKPVRIIIRRKGQKMEAGATRVKGYYDPGMELYLKPVIGSVRAHSTAEAAGLLKGDIVKSVSFGVQTPDSEQTLRRTFEVERWQDIEDALGAYLVEQGKQTGEPRQSVVSISVQRGERRVTVEIAPEPARELLRALAGAGRNDAASFAAEVVGIAPRPGLYVWAIAEGSPLLEGERTEASITRGDRIMAIDKINLGDGRVVHTPQQVRTSMSALYTVPPESDGASEQNAPPHMLVIYQKADGSEHQAGILNPMVSYRAWLEIEQALTLDRSRAQFEQEGLGGAAARGIKLPFEFLDITYQSVTLLVSGQAETDQLMGPVGILQFSYKSAEEGIGDFLRFLAFISINLAVLNILPIPVLDGGHVMFLLAEKLRGKPVSEKTRMRFEIVGLILIGALVLFATWNDVVGRLLRL